MNYYSRHMSVPFISAVNTCLSLCQERPKRFCLFSFYFCGQQLYHGSRCVSVSLSRTVSIYLSASVNNSQYITVCLCQQQSVYTCLPLSSTVNNTCPSSSAAVNTCLFPCQLRSVRISTAAHRNARAAKLRTARGSISCDQNDTVRHK